MQAPVFVVHPLPFLLPWQNTWRKLLQGLGLGLSKKHTLLLQTTWELPALTVNCSSIARRSEILY